MTFSKLAVLFVLPLAVLATPVHASIEVTVGLDVTVLGAAPLHSCDVVVPSGSTVGDVLDAAVAQGCILAWSSESFPGFGRYVTCMDHVVCGAVATYWAFFVDGAYSDFGIDSVVVEQGATYGFDYTQWVVALP